MKLFIRNMVCNRCKLAVKGLLEEMGYQVLSLELGEVEIAGDPEKEELLQINEKLIALGFELIDTRTSRIIEKIKTLIIEMVHYKSEPEQLKHSAYIASKLNYDYTYLSKLFSEVEGITIEQYFINQRIERAKELIVYDELNTSELADVLHYSSVAHFSTQFKKVTGMTPTQFRMLHRKPRAPLDEVGGGKTKKL